MNKWRILKSEYLVKGPWINFRKDEVELPNGQKVDDYYVVETPRVAMVIAQTGDDKIVWVRQYKHGIGAIVVELPAGWIDEGETSEAAAKRELSEETGYRADSVAYVGSLASSVSRMNEVVEVYEALGVKKVMAQQLDVTEAIEVMELTGDEVERMIAAGEIWASVSIAAYDLWQRQKRAK